MPILRVSGLRVLRASFSAYRDRVPLLLAGLALGCGLPGQGPATLTRDIHAIPSSSSLAHGSGFGVVGSTLYLGAQFPLDGLGAELWKSDGTPAGTAPLADLSPGAASSTIGTFHALGATTIFAAADVDAGYELWRTDGTQAGTSRVLDIRPGPTGSNLGEFVVLAGIAYFRADDGASGPELWRTDGSTLGTYRVADIQPGANGSSPRGLVVVGSQVFFAADDGTVGEELWVSDGTTAGTRLVKDLMPGASSSFLTSLVAFGGRVYFGGAEPSVGVELFSSDGTSAGTTLVRDIEPGGGTSQNSVPDGFQVYAGKLYFQASQAPFGMELWASDGTAAGTVMVKDIDPSGASYPTLFVESGGYLFFRVLVNFTFFLCRTDGTSAGTQLIEALYVEDPSGLFDLGGKLFFQGKDRAGLKPYGIWVWDGSFATAAYSASGIDVPATLGAYGGYVYFRQSASDRTIWRTNGITTSRFLTLPRTGSSNPTAVAAAGVEADLVFFIADDGVNGRELWRSDGSALGTNLTRNLNGALTGVQTEVVAVSGRAFFSGSDGAGFEPFVSDGSAAGTVMLKDINPGTGGSLPSGFAVVAGKVFFTAQDPATGRELWVTDGTPAGTVLVKDIRPGTASSLPTSLIAFDQKVYFEASDGVSGFEIWRSDGTAAGTVMVKDIRPGTTNGRFLAPAVFGSMLLFTAAGSGTDLELWRTDGTSAGTSLVRDINPGAAAASNPRSLGRLGSRMLLAATTATEGEELWITDGTSGGTVLVKDIWPGTSNSALVGFAALNGVALFAADDGVSGLELWSSDGTSAGTNRVVDLLPGTGSGILAPGFVFQPQNGARALFAGTNGSTTGELWATDGTAAGTVLHQELDPGRFPSNPQTPVQSGCRLYFAAQTLAGGRELFTMKNMATAVPIGSGCPGTGGKTPAISALGTPFPGNLGFGVGVANALPASPSLLFINNARSDLAFGACTLHPALPAVSAVATTDALGAASIALPLANDPSWIGLELYFQWVVADPNGAYFGLVSFSDGLRVFLANP